MAKSASDEIKKMEIKEIQRKEKRIAAHTHIKGLGLNDDGIANPNAAGLVGQLQAREVSRFSLSHGRHLPAPSFLSPLTERPAGGRHRCGLD